MNWIFADFNGTRAVNNRSWANIFHERASRTFTLLGWRDDRRGVEWHLAVIGRWSKQLSELRERGQFFGRLKPVPTSVQPNERISLFEQSRSDRMRVAVGL